MVVGAIAAVSGLLAGLAGVRPTGSAPVDVVLVALAAAAVTWAAATAPWWAVAAAGLLAALVAAGPVWVLMALAAVAMASVVGFRQSNLPWARSLATLLAVQVLARQELQGFQGLSALVACSGLSALFAVGVWRRPGAVRRHTLAVLGGIGAVVGVSLVGFVIAGLAARAPLEDGNRQAREGLAALDRGDIVAARAAFQGAAKSFAKADDDLSALWAQPARLLPVVAQHRGSLSELSAGAANVSQKVASALAVIDPDSLRMVDGAIDIAAVRSLEQPFTDLRAAVDQLGDVVGAARSPWLAGPLQHRLDDLVVELAKNVVRADNALATVRVAPRILGAEGVRHYFVVFSTPAEARGLGGFMGNWAELTIDNGKLSMSRFGRTAELNTGGSNPTGRRITGLDEFGAHWGRFAFVEGAAGTTDEVAWSNVTMPPDFPTVAKVISQLYPQSGGRPVDGVFALDVETIAALMQYTGPIQLDGVQQPLTSANAAQFILKDQYLISDQVGRVDLLDELARTVVERLLTSSLPPPAELARTFGPLAQQGRLMAWSADPAEQDVFSRVRMAGEFPALEGGDGIAVTLDNDGPNKADAYLEMAVDYRIEADDVDGGQRATATVTLTNKAPPSGLPDAVIGNDSGLPAGTNRTWLSVYTALPMSAVSVDGVVSGMETAQVFGWNVASRYLEIPPGATMTIELQLAGWLTSLERSEVITRVQPLVITPTLQVSRAVRSPAAA